MKTNRPITKYYPKHVEMQCKLYRNVLESVGSDLLIFNEIARGYPYASQMGYYKIEWNTLNIQWGQCGNALGTNRFGFVENK